jgi:hypothetical protein
MTSFYIKVIPIPTQPHVKSSGWGLMPRVC